MKTIDVKALVTEVLADLPKPFSEHVIDDVFHAIELDPKWRLEYDSLCSKLGQAVVNNWCGQWTAYALEKTGRKQVPSKKSSLIESYSLLDADAKPVRKPNEAEAREAMAKYYKEHQAELPAEVRQHRETLVGLIMEGVTPEEAFRIVLEPAN